MNGRRTSWLAIIAVILAPSVASASDMTMMLPIMASPFLIVGIVVSIVIGIVSRKRESVDWLLHIQLLIMLGIGLPGAFLLTVCARYFDSPHADIAISFTLGYILFWVACVLSMWAMFRKGK